MLSQRGARPLLIAAALYSLPAATFVIVWPTFGVGAAVTAALAVLILASLACCGLLSFLASRLRLPFSVECAASMSSETQEAGRVQKRYDRQAGLYDFWEAPVELLAFKRLRRRLWGQVEGSPLLEVGVGTGKNLPYRSDRARSVAVDISPRMLKRAAGRAERPGRGVDLVLADAQHLPFRDGVFDAAAATFVFCSVPDPVLGLREVRRVLRAGGGVHLLEHVRSHNPILGKLMDWTNPLWVRVTGANINRDTVSNVARAGIELKDVESRGFGIMKLIHGSVPSRAPAAVEAADVAHG